MNLTKLGLYWEVSTETYGNLDPIVERTDDDFYEI